MTDSVFLVTHRNPLPGRPNDKVIGVYDTRRAAATVCKELSFAPGFRLSKTGFQVTRLPLDEYISTDELVVYV